MDCRFHLLEIDLKTQFVSVGVVVIKSSPLVELGFSGSRNGSAPWLFMLARRRFSYIHTVLILV